MKIFYVVWDCITDVLMMVAFGIYFACVDIKKMIKGE